MLKKLFNKSKPLDQLDGLKLDIGCGPNKKEGCVGIDIYEGEEIDVTLDIEKDKLPFDDNSVGYVFLKSCL